MQTSSPLWMVPGVPGLPKMLPSARARAELMNSLVSYMPLASYLPQLQKQLSCDSDKQDSAF